MKIGLKFFPETLKSVLPEIESIGEAADFLEIMAVQGTDFSVFRDLGIPINVHAEHSEFGVNPANPDKEESSLKALGFAREAADVFGSKVIVVHAGFFENRRCSWEQVARVLERIGDERFVLENLLLENRGKRHLCATPGEMGKLAERTGLSICLDLSHSVITSLCLGKGPLEVFKGFLAMRPRYYHMCDGRTEEKEDMHLHLGKGNFPLREAKRMLPSGAEVCLEVPTDLEGMLKDVGFLRSL